MNVDSLWNIARGMTVVADMLAGLTLLLLAATLVPFIGNKRQIFVVLASIAVVASIVEGLTLLFFRTSTCTNWFSEYLYTCEIGQDAKFAIGAVVFWVLVGLTTAFRCLCVVG